MFSTVLQLHTLLFQSFEFLHKIIQKGILVISYEGTHLVPAICPWVFSICLHESLIKFCTKIILICVWVSLSQFESFLPQGYFSLFTSNKFWAERHFKIPHFGSLFVFRPFCQFFTLFSIYFFLPVLFYFLQFSPSLMFNCKLVQILLKKLQISPIFIFLLFYRIFAD